MRMPIRDSSFAILADSVAEVVGKKNLAYVAIKQAAATDKSARIVAVNRARLDLTMARIGRRSGDAQVSNNVGEQLPANDSASTHPRVRTPKTPPATTITFGILLVCLTRSGSPQ